MLNLSERGVRFVAAPHLFEDVGKNHVLARLIRLARNGAALDCVGFLKAIVVDSEKRALI